VEEVAQPVSSACEQVSALKIALLFPGQGSQAVGMGRELAASYAVARRTFEEADDALGYKLSDVCWNGPEDQLKLTEITQPAILTASVAVLRVLREKGIAAAFAAGHSLGEYSAHVGAGTLEFTDAVRTVRNRGKYMQEAVPIGEGAMAAILGLPLEQVARQCAEAAQGSVCEPANINSPDQVVISGARSAVERAAALAKHHGAKRAVLLPVSAPFHSSLMRPAQERLAADLAGLPFRQPSFPVMCNVDAVFVESADASRDALVRQVTGPVQWERSMRGLIAAGADLFVEAGPGKVLTGLMRQIDRAQTSFNVENDASLEKLAAHLQQKPSPV
jgi:[acyl-carrier-protein] S-malonyltransferase